MKLNSLTITEFKGVQEFTLYARGRNVDIYAANGVGKTSLADSFSWLLFGRDSLGRADFGIIPTDADGVLDEGASPTVTAELALHGGETITLQRRLVQKTASVRGAAPTSAGTTTEFAVNGAPVKKTEFSRRIAEMADEALFPLLTDPRAFCGTLHWQKRRDLLLRLFGGATDADIIAAELSALPAILGKRSIDEHRRMLAPKLAELKKQLAAIPARIDEVKLSIPPAPAGDPAAEHAALREARRDTLAEMERIAVGGESAELRRQRAELYARILDAETAAKRADAERLEKLESVRRAARDTLAVRERMRVDIEWHIDGISRDLNRLAEESAETADQSERVAKMPLPEVGFDDACPACGQTLPPERLRAAVAEAMAEHNRKRSEALERLSSQRAAIASQYEDVDRERDILRNHNAGIEALIAEAEESFNAADAAVQAFIPTEPATHALHAEVENLTDKIAALDSGNADALDDVRTRLDAIDSQILDAEIAVADLWARDKAAERIAALNSERRTIAAELDTVEGELALCDRFTRLKIEHTTEAINRRFGSVRWKLFDQQATGVVAECCEAIVSAAAKAMAEHSTERSVRWKLFDQQVNGEIVDCCEATVNGVPWRDLSNSQQINAGLGVIDVIGLQYGITPPIFIDNAESVSDIRPTTAQQIRLIVSAAHKQLTVEIK